jgi:hypothetical protein
MRRKTIHSRRFNIGFFTSLLLLTSFLQLADAQQGLTAEINKTYKITLIDGSAVTGKLLLINGQELAIFSATIGELHIQRENIKSIVQVNAVNEKGSAIWYENPNPSKYLLGNSAIPMDQNTGYYQNIWIFVNSFSYAFTKNFSMSGGFEIISLLAGGEGPYLFYVNPKFSFRISQNFYAGGNLFYANSIKTAQDFAGLATLNAFATYGNKNSNVTGAIGYGWADGVFSPRPIIILSGMVRASRRIAFVSENWIIPSVSVENNNYYHYYGIFSYGIRFLGEKISIDLAFINNPDIAETTPIGIPWLDFVIVF